MLMLILLIKPISMKSCKKSIGIVDVHYHKCLINSLQQQSFTTGIKLSVTNCTLIGASGLHTLMYYWECWSVLLCGVPAPGVIR